MYSLQGYKKALYTHNNETGYNVKVYLDLL